MSISAGLGATKSKKKKRKRRHKHKGKKAGGETKATAAGETQATADGETEATDFTDDEILDVDLRNIPNIGGYRERRQQKLVKEGRETPRCHRDYLFSKLHVKLSQYNIIRQMISNEHLKERCPHCQQWVRYSFMDNHLYEFCHRRLVKCTYCTRDIQAKSITKHTERCKEILGTSHQNPLRNIIPLYRVNFGLPYLSSPHNIIAYTEGSMVMDCRCACAMVLFRGLQEPDQFSRVLHPRGVGRFGADLAAILLAVQRISMLLPSDKSVYIVSGNKKVVKTLKNGPLTSFNLVKVVESLNEMARMVDLSLVYVSEGISSPAQHAKLLATKTSVYENPVDIVGTLKSVQPVPGESRNIHNQTECPRCFLFVPSLENHRCEKDGNPRNRAYKADESKKATQNPPCSHKMKFRFVGLIQQVSLTYPIVTEPDRFCPICCYWVPAVDFLEHSRHCKKQERNESDSPNDNDSDDSGTPENWDDEFNDSDTPENWDDEFDESGMRDIRYEKCQFCKILFVCTELYQHMENECSQRSVLCRGCNFNIPKKQRSNHCQVCSRKNTLLRKIEIKKDPKRKRKTNRDTDTIRNPELTSTFAANPRYHKLHPIPFGHFFIPALEKHQKTSKLKKGDMSGKTENPKNTSRNIHCRSECPRCFLLSPSLENHRCEKDGNPLGCPKAKKAGKKGEIAGGSGKSGDPKTVTAGSQKPKKAKKGGKTNKSGKDKKTGGSQKAKKAKKARKDNKAGGETQPTDCAPGETLFANDWWDSEN